MLELRHFRALERSRIESPHHALKFFAGPRDWVVFRIAPARSHIVELSIARESQPAAMVCEHVNGEGGVASLGCRSKVLNPRPLAFIWPNAHQVRIGAPGGSVDTFAIG